MSTEELAAFANTINFINGVNKPKKLNIIGSIIEIIKNGAIPIIMSLILVTISSL